MGFWKIGRRSTFFIEKLCSATMLTFGDDAHNGYVNKQNCRFWSEDQPDELQKLPVHPEKVTVWCNLWAGGIIRPYLFKDAANRNVIVNDDHHREMISNFFLPKMQQLAWQLVSTRRYHTARITRDLLRGKFAELFISREGPVNCPSRSCDLWPLD